MTARDWRVALLVFLAAVAVVYGLSLAAGRAAA